MDKGCGHKLMHLFPVCYQSLSFILFSSRSVECHVPQRFVLRRCLKNLTMGNPINHSEHFFTRADLASCKKDDFSKRNLSWKSILSIKLAFLVNSIYIKVLILLSTWIKLDILLFNLLQPFSQSSIHLHSCE